MNRFYIIILSLIFLVSPNIYVFGGTNSSAKTENIKIEKREKKTKSSKKRRKGKKSDEPDTLKKKETKYEKLFKKAHRVEKGMIDLHLLDGKVYFEMPLALLGGEMVLGSTIKSISDNKHGIVGSKPMGLKHLKFEKADSTIQIRAIDAAYMSSDPNIQRAISQSLTGSVIKNIKIEAWSPDSSAVVFNMTDFFMEHDKDLSPFATISSYSAYTRKEDFKKDLSFITDIKSFEDNLSVSSSMSYSYTMTNRLGKEVVRDGKLTAELTRSILLLPEETYHPRMADYRIGVFFTERTAFGDRTNNSKHVYFANRWRLEPSDTLAYRAGKLVKPIKPITFYIDNNFPEWWKPYIKEGVEQWQELFEEIGFKDAIIALDYPTDEPSFDPDNIKYSCIRYAPINVQNAMGPSWVDPRSGEIINASVYVYHDILKLLTNWMFVQTSQADTEVRQVELPQEVLGDAIRYVVSHEIGHCLGFMHNMSASSVIPVESLRDPEFTQKHGTTTSIMDYARFNYVAQPGDKERGVKLTPPRFGSYDKWLIEWTYRPVFDTESFEEEAEITSRWISEALKKDDFYRYGKQQMGAYLYDPRSQSEDLGDDAVAATKYGVANLKYILANYMDWIKEGDDEYVFRTGIYNGILNQYVMYAQHVAMNVGGLYKNEIKSGDTMKRFENVPRAKQLEALDYLFTLQDDLSWLGDRKVLDRLPVVGSPEYIVSNAIQDIILMTPGFASVSDGVTTSEFNAIECIDFIFKKVFEPTRKSMRLGDNQRFFQKRFVHSFIKMGRFKLPGEKKSFNLNENFRSLSEDYFGSSEESPLFGEIIYGPISGYEWAPRNIFNRGDLTVSDIYAILKRAKELMTKYKNTGSEQDKAHYELMILTIDYSIK